MEQRRLSALLFTDIKGYSSQMEADEAEALRRLEIHNRIFRERLPQFDGREIKTVGDAFMVEFASAVQAVSCALAIQRALAEHNAAHPDDTILVRMGVHAGDVVERDGDLFGETVNLAARLEPQAPPGTVCVADAVLAQVVRKVDATCTPLGPRALKNIAQPLPLYALAPADSRLEAPAGPGPSEPPRSRMGLAIGVGVATLGLLGLVVWTQSPVSTAPDPMEAAPTEPDATTESPLADERQVCLVSLEPIDVDGAWVRALDLQIRNEIDTRSRATLYEIGAFPFDEANLVRASEAARLRNCRILVRGGVGRLGSRYIANLELAAIGKRAEVPVRTYRMVDDIDALSDAIPAMVDELVSGADVVLDKAVMTDTVAASSRLLIPCYAEALERQPALKGTLRLRWNVDESGRTQDVEVVESLEPGLDVCAVEVASDWLFPVGVKSGVEWPFQFAPE